MKTKKKRNKKMSKSNINALKVVAGAKGARTISRYIDINKLKPTLEPKDKKIIEMFCNACFEHIKKQPDNADYDFMQITIIKFFLIPLSEFLRAIEENVYNKNNQTHNLIDWLLYLTTPADELVEFSDTVFNKIIKGQKGMGFRATYGIEELIALASPDELIDIKAQIMINMFNLTSKHINKHKFSAEQNYIRYYFTKSQQESNSND